MPAPPSSRFEIAKDGVSRIVVGYDGSGPSRDAVAFAAGIARRDRAELVLVYVETPTALTGFADAAGVVVPPVGTGLTEPLEAEILCALHDVGLDTCFVRRAGDVAGGIETVADELRADAIVVGRSAARIHSVVGSVATRLVRIAQRPVVIVP